MTDNQVGRAIGWKVDFPELHLAFDQSTHYAHIDANLPDGLNGGLYRIEIEGMNNKKAHALKIRRLLR